MEYEGKNNVIYRDSDSFDCNKDEIESELRKFKSVREILQRKIDLLLQEEKRSKDSPKSSEFYGPLRYSTCECMQGKASTRKHSASYMFDALEECITPSTHRGAARSQLPICRSEALDFEDFRYDVGYGFYLGAIHRSSSAII